MPISRRQLLWRTTVGAAFATAAPSLVEGSVAAAATDNATEAGSGRLHFPLSLTGNCNPYGPSERVTAALLAAVKAGNADPERENTLLRHQIAREHGVTQDQVVLASGSTEIMRLAVRAFLPAGKKLITAKPTFDAISIQARNLKRAVVSLPLNQDHSHDLEAMLSRCDSTTGLVYVCNPNNPTGSLTRRRDLEAFIAQLPATTMVVIDEAYHHYVDDASDYRSFIDHPIRDSRIVVTRSFSKIYGLAPLRIGYAVGSAEAIARLEAHRTSDGLNVMASRAAMAALADSEYVRVSRIRNGDDRQEFFNQANARMVRWIDSQTNFVMIKASRPAADVVAHFQSNRILLPAPYAGYENYTRVAVGTPAQMQEFWRVWDLMPGGGHGH